MSWAILPPGTQGVNLLKDQDVAVQVLHLRGTLRARRRSPLARIQKLMGHATLAMTVRYSLRVSLVDRARRSRAQTRFIQVQHGD